MKHWQDSEIQAHRAIEDRGFAVLNANIVFRFNCPNIDAIVCARAGVFYVQFKSSTNPAGKDCVLVDGSPWTDKQLYDNAPIYNRYSDDFQASFIVIVEKRKNGETEFCIAPPDELERLARERALEHATRQKRDGTQRAISFRKEFTREVLACWRNAWHLLGEPARG